MPAPEPGAAYERAFEDGRVAALLAAHEGRLNKINGSQERTVEALEQLTLAVQHLSDQADSAAATAVTTAKALKDADDARRSRSDQSWSPFAKTIALIASLATMVGAVLGIYAVMGR
jgi:methyl-accepting chemotaxis protein